MRDRETRRRPPRALLTPGTVPNVSIFVPLKQLYISVAQNCFEQPCYQGPIINSLLNCSSLKVLRNPYPQETLLKFLFKAELEFSKYVCFVLWLSTAQGLYQFQSIVTLIKESQGISLYWHNTF